MFMVWLEEQLYLQNQSEDRRFILDVLVIINLHRIK